jgi:hypothetical protein
MRRTSVLLSCRVVSVGKGNTGGALVLAAAACIQLGCENRPSKPINVVLVAVPLDAGSTPVAPRWPPPPEPPPPEPLPPDEPPVEPEQPVDCAAIRPCVRAKVPRVLGMTELNARRGKVRTCFGDSKEEIWRAHKCPPIEIGRDRRNGQRIEAVVTCSDICPDQAFVNVRYVAMDEAECACWGGGPLTIWPQAYVGCIPSERTGLAPLEFFGIVGNDEIKEVDGRSVTPVQALRVLEKLPFTLPRSVTVSGSRYYKQIRYIRQPEIERLRAAFGPESSRDPHRNPVLPCKPGAEKRAVFIDDRKGHGFYPECPGETNARLAALANLIEQMFDSPRQSAPRPPASSISCTLIHQKPFAFGIMRTDNINSHIELRWADWIRPGPVARD